MRGCGERKTDGLYICCGFSLLGQPIEYFIIDPPIDPELYGIKFSRGFGTFEKDRVTHLIDWIGSDYESPWDFIMECREKGASRRVSKAFDLSKLSSQSMIYFVHKEAIDTKYTANGLSAKEFYLPNGETIAEVNYTGLYSRQIGDLKYKINYKTKPPGQRPVKPGIFFRLPITHIDYVRPANQEELEKLKMLSLPIKICQE